VKFYKEKIHKKTWKYAIYKSYPHDSKWYVLIAIKIRFDSDKNTFW